jgi:hypothetical protein
MPAYICEGMSGELTDKTLLDYMVYSLMPSKRKKGMSGAKKYQRASVIVEIKTSCGSSANAAELRTRAAVERSTSIIIYEVRSK